MEQRLGSCRFNHAVEKAFMGTLYDGCRRFVPAAANAAVCLCSHGANYHADLGEEVNGGQIVSPNEIEQNVWAVADESKDDPAANAQGMKAGGSKTEAPESLDAAGGNAASSREHLDFGQPPTDFESLAANQGISEQDGEFQACAGSGQLLQSGEVEAGEGETELRVSETAVGGKGRIEESDLSEEKTGLSKECIELTLKEIEPPEKILAVGAQQDSQGMGNAEVLELPAAKRKRPRVSSSPVRRNHTCRH
jgi:hypothetical protein